ncbi:MAG: alanine--tRNA ligase [Coriobacteriales bacterium]|jgi:alanyl-tRNA synthetase|nr:alanine--tRNA ligase [Coriobacteriales bacterium]
MNSAAHPLTSAELREQYLAFFESKGCQRWPSSSLIPDDPSLLLTSAGMVQFKPWFLQLKQLEQPYIGAVSVQKCVRTTDIDIIGTDGRHLSFFEMLGSFSFGTYFKQEMCEWALEFSLEVLGFDLDRIYFTIFEDDDETLEIWKSIGIPAERIFKLGESDNFWRAGPTGPCGPCSELYYDMGEHIGCGSPDCAPGCDCDRFLEYWNCVYTQFDGQEDGSLVPLPKQNIDTGMGLERTIAILNGYESVFKTDILRSLISISEQLASQVYGSNERFDLSMRIIADHIRSCTFMIGDGVLPSNEGRGYVLRRLLRRAMRHGHLLGIQPPFLSQSVDRIVELMGDAYPEIEENHKLIERVVLAEEERFAQTLRLGQNYLEDRLASLSPGGQLDGKSAFELHDRYGFPIDLTVEIANEAGFDVDRTGFEIHMAEQRRRARSAIKEDAWGSVGGVFTELAAKLGSTQFVGYDLYQSPAVVLAIVIEKDGAAALVNEITDGQAAQVILDTTPFYAEMGGQVGDTGTLSLATTNSAFLVSDTQAFDHLTTHIGSIDGVLRVGDEVVASIDIRRRMRIERNHTGTHLLHHALRQVLGDHVKQAGSLVAPNRLRFDFTHFEQPTPAQLESVEALANELIMADGEVTARTTSLDAARDAGVIALFGEKYTEQVRVLSAGDESHELCGGTHVRHTAQIGLIKIVSEGSVGATLRRIEAVTSYDALEFVKREEQQLHAAAALLKTRPAGLSERIEALQQQLHDLEVASKTERRQALLSVADELMAARLPNTAFTIVVTRFDGLDAEEMRSLWDRLRETLSQDPEYTKAAALIVGGVTKAGSPLLIAAATDAAVEQGFDANLVIKQIAPAIQGGGGGKPTMAQAGGKDRDGLDTALAHARQLLSS